MKLGEPRRGREPRGPKTGLPHAVSAEHAGVDNRLIDPIPGVGVLRVDLTELGQKMANLKLKTVGQGRRGEKGFFKFDRSLAGAWIDRGEDMRLAGEVGVNGTGQRNFGLTQGEATLFRVVTTALQRRNRGVPLAGAAGKEQNIGRNINEAQLRVPAQRL